MSCVVTLPESRAAADEVSACTAIQFAMNAVSSQATSVHQVAATNVIAAG
jgi:hypothetical protein